MFGQQIYLPLEAHEGYVSTLRFSPDGNILASAGEDGMVRLWNVGDGSESINQQLCPPLVGYKGYVHIQFSPNGKTLAASYEDNTTRIWDVDQESELFGGQIGPPLHQYLLDYSPDGKYLTSGDSLGKIKLWDMTTHKAMEISLPGEIEEGVTIYGLSFSHDGHTLVVVLNDGRIVKWDFDLKSLQTRACQRANRNLTQEEWQRFFGDEPYQATCPDLPVGEADAADELDLNYE
jgi:WD40 repeat protein